MSDATSLFDLPTNPEAKPELTGQVQVVLFAAQDSFYKVLLVEPSAMNFEHDAEEITVTGSFGDIQTGSEYTFTGKLTEHARYGRQFAAEHYERNATKTTKGLIAYFASEKFPGIGESTAKKIVDQLGLTAIDQILSDPSTLATLGLSEKQRTAIQTQLEKADGMERVIVALNSYGFGASLATQIYEKYQGYTLEILQENPYQLVQDFDGISFARMDQLAAQQGIVADDPRRVKAAVLATLSLVTFELGDTYIPVQLLLERVVRLLEQTQNQRIETAGIEAALLELTEEGLIVAEGENLYPKALYEAECLIAEKLLALTRRKQGGLSRKTAQQRLNDVNDANPFDYDPTQSDAILAALTSQLFILTGGPGTGKTTIVNGIVQAYLRQAQADGKKPKDAEAEVLLAAPTGRAAKRLSESTGMPASTIHRLLGITGRESQYDYDLEPLTGQLLVIDEMSMVDTELFALLLSAVPAGMQIVLVGDKDQLPSVGPGRVFNDLLNSGLLNYRELDVIHRQGKGSTITTLARDVKQGQLPADFTQKQPDRSFFEVAPDRIAPLIEQIAEAWLAKGNSVADMQILSPMYKTPAGVHNLNEIAQEIFNPKKGNKRELSWKQGDRLINYRVGDKVMQTANDPENNVFNGDVGYVTTIMYAKDPDNPEKVDQLEVRFDTGDVVYTRQNLHQLSLAYATTIHKAQGGEYKLVIMPLTRAFARMLQRNLLYTGLTRASEALVMLGDARAFQHAAQNEGEIRQTTLQARLQAVPVTDTAAPEPAAVPEPVVEGQLTTALVEAETIDPNIGMDGVSPQDV